jgi:hypothetical protein
MKVKTKIRKFLTDAWGETAYGLRMLCGKPTPLKRLVMVLLIGGALAATNIYFVANSIYNMGKRDAEKKFLELQHIKPVELPISGDSIHSIKNFKWEKIKN